MHAKPQAAFYRSSSSNHRQSILVIHIAVLLRPYLDLVLSGAKTVECRLTRQARDPYQSIEPGDRTYFKESAGDFEASAVAEHVLFESDLTPGRINEIKRDYNHLIRGEDQFWSWKRDSRYCTLVWLKDVQPISSGPQHAPLQGRAWLCLDEEPAWRRIDQSASEDAAPNGCFSIEVTPGNLKNNTLYATRVIDRFPSWTIGGASRRAAAKPITLILHEGPTVQSDIVAGRKLLRTRVWGPWFKRHGVKAGDLVMFTPIDRATYTVGLARPT
jgi:ASC-1-like (ASCH) protein